MSEERFDYILARIDVLNRPEATIVIRKYHRGEADILTDPLAEVVASSVEELAKKVNEYDCLPWDRDRVIGYDGPQVCEGLGRVILPLMERDSVKEYIRHVPGD